MNDFMSGLFGSSWRSSLAGYIGMGFMLASLFVKDPHLKENLNAAAVLISGGGLVAARDKKAS